MPASRLCKSCGRSIIIWNSAQTRCAACQKARSHAKPPKPISKHGKHAEAYETWKKTVAIPYLDKRYGHVCSHRGCTETQNLDVDHKLGRGSHPHLKMVVGNVQYLCRTHHRMKTDRKLD